jgi:rubrerythrin
MEALMEKKISTIRGVIEFAREKEAESAGMYQILARQADSERAANIFNKLAMEEDGHRRTLEQLDLGGHTTVKVNKVLDLKISDYLREISYSPDMTYQDILVFAMKNEEHSHHLYQGLADHSADRDLKNLFEFLAMQEAGHKLRLESEYDDAVLKED